jgi:hypothetical protein
MNELQDIFEAYSLCTPEGNNLEILQKFIAKYPHFERELCEFAKERAMLRIESEISLSEAEKERIELLTRRNFQKYWMEKTASAKPLESLTEAAKKLGMRKAEFAKRIGLNGHQLYNLEIRAYIFSSIPQSLIESIAETLQTTREAVNAFLRQPPSLAANFKSQTRPQDFKQISFAEAIRQDDTLSAEEKERLINMK